MLKNQWYADVSADRRRHDGDDVQPGKTVLVQRLTAGLRTSERNTITRR
jgi:hypothetical protein